MEKAEATGTGKGLEAVSSGSSESLLQQSSKKSKNIYTNRSYRLNVINWWNVYVQVFIPYTFFGVLGLLVANTMYEMQNLHLGTTALTSIVLEARDVLTEQHGLGMRIAAVVLIVLVYLAYRERPVYLVDFSTFKAPEHWKVTQDELLLIMKRQGCYEEGSLEFMRKILEKSGTSNHTAWPPNFTKCVKEDVKGDDTIEAAREESKAVIYGCIDDLIKKTGLQMKKVDFLIINCSLFSPTPSLCALVANHYAMKPDIQSYNLSGMGCSASVLSIELARQLLASNPGCTALVVSTENLTQNMYYGNERGMLLQNTLFRCGGAAMLLSNRWGDGLRAKYKLLHAVRTTNAKPDAYEAVYECQDKELHRGIRLSKDIVQVAGRTMKQNLTALGPYVLPVREQSKVVISMVGAAITKKLRSILEKNGKSDLAAKIPEIRSYVPDFKRGIDHFCVHAGGRAVIDGIEKNLQLQPHHLEASRSTLYHYGNTSSSSIWYELEFIEDKGIQRGDRVLQIAFGSGFKCNSAVWLRMR